MRYEAVAELMMMISFLNFFLIMLNSFMVDKNDVLLMRLKDSRLNSHFRMLKLDQSLTQHKSAVALVKSALCFSVLSKHDCSVCLFSCVSTCEWYNKFDQISYKPHDQTNFISDVKIFM